MVSNSLMPLLLTQCVDPTECPSSIWWGSWRDS